MSSDPAAGAPAAVAAGAPGARLVAARNGRIPFEILAAITVVGVAAAGRFAEAALVAFIVGLGAWLGRRPREAAADAARRARIESHTDPAPARERAPLAERALSGFADWFMPLAIAVAAAVLLRNADVVLALTLLLVASPQALLALPRSSPAALRALAASAAAALLVATLAGLLGPVAAALLLQASTLAARFGQRLAPVGRGRPPA